MKHQLKALRHFFDHLAPQAQFKTKRLILTNRTMITGFHPTPRTYTLHTLTRPTLTS
ncbi:hypothetical protein Hanom_Chr03g00217891 [Helianthus anomalus]